MSSPLQITIDLNEIVKKIVGIAKDAKYFERDSSDITKRLRREVSKTTCYDEIIKRPSFTASIGQFHQATLLDAVSDVYQAWKDLDAFLEQAPELSSSATWPAANPPASASTAAQKSNRSRLWISWAWKGKAKATRLLNQVRLSNEFLSSSINDIQKYREQSDAPKIIPVSLGASGALDQPQLELLAYVNRLSVQQGSAPLDKSLLQDIAILEMRDSPSLEPASNLRRDLAAGRPVLVESLPFTGFFDNALERAISLAMLLAQPRVEGIGILPCIGVCQNEAAQRFEYVFDMKAPIADLPLDANFQGPNGPDSFVAGFRSLHSQLSKPEKAEADQSRVLRHYKTHEARLHQPISIGDRVALALGLARTLQHLHQAEWLHGNINSKNIFFFHQHQHEPDITPGGDIEQSGELSKLFIGTPYLFGFQFTRLDHDYSDRLMYARVAVRDNLYRHPQRQIFQDMNKKEGLTGPEKPHRPEHDIYSLGVVMLEIGLGRSADELVKLAPNMTGRAIEEVASKMTDEVSAARLARLVYIEQAKISLPGVMGNTYAGIALICLRGMVQASEALVADGQGDKLAWSRQDIDLSSAFLSRVVEPLDRLLQAVG